MAAKGGEKVLSLDPRMVPRKVTWGRVTGFSRLSMRLVSKFFLYFTSPSISCVPAWCHDGLIENGANHWLVIKRIIPTGI